MSDRQLSEDTASWPSDPYELLGVTYSDDAKTVRRAYFRLVRRFKPEHYPAQFQRIREAYDIVNNQAAMNQLFDEYPAEEETGFDGFPFGGTTATVDSRSVFADPVKSQSDETWQLAVDGQEDDAYVKLQSIVNQYGGASEVYAQLYWLLKIDPNLDSERRPSDWLAAGLRESRLTGPLRELYRRELENSQAEAASARCTSLVECEAPAGRLADLVQWRWQASPSPTLIAQDLMHLRNRFLPDDEATWFRLLLIAVDHLAWTKSREPNDLLRRCTDEIDHMEHLHQTYEHELDRMDLLLEVSDQWWRVEYQLGVPDEWKQLIPDSWTRPFHQLRPQLLRLMQSIAEDPLRGLETFDRLAERSPGAVAHLGEHLELMYRYDGIYDDEGLDATAVWRLLEKFIVTYGREYILLRKPLLTFCLENAVDPHAVGRIADEHERHSWSDPISNDGPFQYVYAAYRHILG